MQDIWTYVRALSKYWWSLMSSALFTFMAIYVAAAGKSDVWVFWASIAMALSLFFVAGFMAWRKEHSQLISRPIILVDWKYQDGGTDIIKFRNVGNETALNISLGQFSWNALGWHRQILIPSLDPSQTRECEAQFFREISPTLSELGYMKRILELPETPKPLSISISLENLARTKIEGSFVLDLVEVGDKREIRCNPGKWKFSQN